MSTTTESGDDNARYLSVYLEVRSKGRKYTFYSDWMYLYVAVDGMSLTKYSVSNLPTLYRRMLGYAR